MNIKEELPPNFKDIHDLLGIDEKSIIIYTFGDTIYNPNKANITADLVVHESTHEKQQGATPNLWWQRYLKDAEFRITQEVEAYGNQYKFICKSVKDKNKREKWLIGLARHMSSPMYGSIIDLMEAKQRIRKISLK